MNKHRYLTHVNRGDGRLPYDAMALVCATFALLCSLGCESHSSAPEEAMADAEGPQTQERRRVERESDSQSGKELYAVHCAACHGNTGDGTGMAARHLHPKPRNLRAGGHRLVKTINLVPTAEDLESVIARGMPGSSMPNHEHLNDRDVTKLVGEVLQMRRDSAGQHILRFFQEELDAEDMDEEEVEEILDKQLTPGPVVDLPDCGHAAVAAIAKGKETFLRQGCQKCHGPEGKGDGNIYLVDDQGNPIRPRNLVYDRLKGGNEPESICVRILLGMPGSPMPASVNLDEDQLIALVHYCGSLAREPKRRLTNYQRAIEAISR